jgi:hypothetical protein
MHISGITEQITSIGEGTSISGFLGISVAALAEDEKAQTKAIVLIT